MRRTKVAVIGCGHLGVIHARLLAAREDVELVAVVDPLAESRDRVAAALAQMDDDLRLRLEALWGAEPKVLLDALPRA